MKFKNVLRLKHACVCCWLKTAHFNFKTCLRKEKKLCCFCPKGNTCDVYVWYGVACAHAIDVRRRQKKKELGCTVLYLSVFPCTHRNIKGTLLF